MKIVGGPAARKKAQEASAKKQVKIDVRSMPIAETGLALRTQNTLETHNIITVGQLAKKTTQELLAIPNLGAITIQKLRVFLDGLDLHHRLNEEPEVSLQSDKKQPGARKQKFNPE
jgi:DNA-directed RNA polymerase alpha subunit